MYLIGLVLCFVAAALPAHPVYGRCFAAGVGFLGLGLFCDSAGIGG